MLALCLMLLVTYHALNYAGIVGLGLKGSRDQSYITTKSKEPHLIPTLASELYLGAKV